MFDPNLEGNTGNANGDGKASKTQAEGSEPLGPVDKREVFQ